MYFRLVPLLLISLLLGCNSDKGIDPLELQKRIVYGHEVELLYDETWYFPAKRPGDTASTVLPLNRFDLIFGGYDTRTRSDTTYERIIPGDYSHMLTYLGKDANGFAYGIEMNTDEDRTYSMGLNGLQVKGQLYLYCLGSDFNEKPCPADLYFFGIERYDFLSAKTLIPDLKTTLMAHESELLATIKQDLDMGFPFQLPFKVTLETAFTREIHLLEDGRRHGTDCVDYIVSLFEEKAGVCMDDIRISADEITSYFLNDPEGKTVLLPAEYNPFSQDDRLISDMLTEDGYSIVDNPPRQATCPEGRVVSGIAIPSQVYNSSSLITPMGDK